MRPDGIPVVLVGLGEDGRAIARAVVARAELTLVAAVDRDPTLAGTSLDALLGGGAPEVRVESDLSKALGRARGGVLLQSGVGRLDDALPDVRAAVKAGLHVVSTCPELAYPALDRADDAEALDTLCEQRGVAVVSTGVTPGFSLDRLPALLAQVAGPIRHVRAVRVVDLASDDPLRRLVGVGLSEAAFDDALEREELGQLGLAQSAALVAESCIGTDDYEVDEELVPLVAEEDGAVRRGEVAGVQQIARVFAEDQEVVRLELTIQVGAREPRDEVELDAVPPLRLLVPGGVPGAAGTANAVVNAIPAVMERQGLLTVLDLPVGR